MTEWQGMEPARNDGSLNFSSAFGRPRTPVAKLTDEVTTEGRQFVQCANAFSQKGRAPA